MKCSKCGADIPFDQNECPVCHSNNKDEGTKKKPKSIGIIIIIALIVVAIIVGVILVVNKEDSPGDTKLFKVNGVTINKSEYSMILMEEALALRNEHIAQVDLETLSEDEQNEYFKKLDDFWNNDIDGKAPFEIVKERALDKMRSYAFYKIEAEEAELQMDDTERQGFEALIESNLQTQGVKIDSNDPNAAYLEIFGVTRSQHMDYMVNQTIAEVYFLQESNKLSASESEIEEYFNKSRYDFATSKVDNIFLSFKDKDGKLLSENEIKAKKDLANQLKDKINNGDFASLAKEYSEDSGAETNDGRYVITKDSLVVKTFGQEFIEWALNAKVNDVEIIETVNGINIAKCIEIAKYEGADDDIATAVKQLKYHDIVDDKIHTEEYDPVVVDEKALNEIKKVPGNLVY